MTRIQTSSGQTRGLPCGALMADPDHEASISLVEERELPEAVVDDVRSRLSCGDIIRSNLVCKGWAAVSETPYFLQLWRERLPCTTTTWGLEVQVRRARGQGENFKVVNLKALDSSKHRRRLVAADLQVPDLWRQQYLCIMACCSADGLICLTGYQRPSYCRRITVANPLTKEPLHVLPYDPVECSDVFSCNWDSVMQMVADPGSEGHYKVLLASYGTWYGSLREATKLMNLILGSNEVDQLDSDDEGDIYDRYSEYVCPRLTAIYSSRTGAWQARVHLSGEPTVVAAIGGVVNMVHRVKSGTYGFVALNIHEALPDPEHEHEEGCLPACSWRKTWPAASWKGVQIPPIVVRQDAEHTMQLLACLGRLLMVTVPDIFEFLPSEAEWARAFTMPSDMEEWFKDPRGFRYVFYSSKRSICQCFEQDGVLRFVNGGTGAGIIFDVRVNAYVLLVVRRRTMRHRIHAPSFAPAFRPSLRPARGGSRTPLGDLLARRPRPPREEGDGLLCQQRR